MAADGMPLDVAGTMEIEVALGLFNTKEEFTIVRNLAVDYLLGADFLSKHTAVLDFSSGTLSVGRGSHHQIPITMGQCPVKLIG